MQQTKPMFIIKKYKSILWAAIIVEAVNYIVSLTDSIIAGNMLGSEALAAIGLNAPFLAFSTFLASIVNSGTIVNYSYQVGRFDKKRAQEFFSQGIIIAIILGVFYAGLLMILRNFIIYRITEPGIIQEYTLDYYNIIWLFFLINPISFLLDNIIVADGDEKLSAVANVVQIISNIALSLVLVAKWGIKGVALGSFLSKFLFILIISIHFFRKNSTIKMVLCFKWADCFKIVKSGIVKASTYVLESITYFFVNLFALKYFFDDEPVIVLIAVEKFLGLLTLFIGFSMAAQPLIGTLKGENNLKALRFLMRIVCLDLLLAGIILTVLTIVFAPLLVKAFGFYTEPLYTDGIIAIRIIGSTLTIHAILILFFIYYYLMEENFLALVISVVRNLISPLVLALIFTLIFKNYIGMCLGFALAPAISFFICAQIVFHKTKKNLFPFLLPHDMDDKILIYDFEINPENVVDMSETAQNMLKNFSVSDKTCIFVGTLIEDIFMLVLEKNTKKKIHAECTIIVEQTGVRLIMRDSGIIFDVTKEDASIDSFRQFIIPNLMFTSKNKSYMTTSGYNRIELFFAE